MLTEIFERVCVINMERRRERLDSFFMRLPVDWPFRYPERYEAVDGEITPPPKWWKGGNGAWGCYRTHLNILEECLNRGINSILILEDDAICVDGFRDKVEHFWNNLPDDWTMLYLGGQHLQENIRLPRKVNDWVYRPYNVNRTHCYGIRGRKMLETVYRHLHDHTSWNVDHHVDHYLGELHKTTENGLYVPREWLVAQSEGQSDICGKKETYRLFPGSEETAYPIIDLQCVAVMGNYFSGVNTIAGTLHKINLFLGSNLGQTDAKDGQQYFEEVSLGNMCRTCFSEPWLEEKLPSVDRVNHLRRWAGLQCKSKPGNAKNLCGKHPILSLMGPELMEAWNNPKILCIDRPNDECYEAMKQVSWCWHPQTAKYSFELLRQSREIFFEQHKPSLLRIAYHDVKTSPERVIRDICGFLGHIPTGEQLKNAVCHAERTQDDLCLIHNNTTASP